MVFCLEFAGACLGCVFLLIWRRLILWSCLVICSYCLINVYCCCLLLVYFVEMCLRGFVCLFGGWLVVLVCLFYLVWLSCWYFGCVLLCEYLVTLLVALFVLLFTCLRFVLFVCVSGLLVMVFVVCLIWFVVGYVILRLLLWCGWLNVVCLVWLCWFDFKVGFVLVYCLSLLSCYGCLLASLFFLLFCLIMLFWVVYL